MKHFLAVVMFLGLTAGVVMAQTDGPGVWKTWSTTQKATGNAVPTIPSFDPADGGPVQYFCDAGLPLRGLRDLTTSVKGPRANIWPDGGTLEGFAIDPGDTTDYSCGTLKRVPALDFTVDVNNPTRDWSGPAKEVGIDRGWAFWRVGAMSFSSPDGGVYDGGTNIEIRATGRVETK